MTGAVNLFSTDAIAIEHVFFFTRFPFSVTMAKYHRQIGIVMILGFLVFFACDCGAVEKDKTAEVRKHGLQVDQLLLQRKILATMDLYEEFSKDSIEREKDLKRLLGKTPYSEAIVELFQGGNTPTDLIPAQSAWKIWFDLETDRWSLRLWLDEVSQKNDLANLENAIRTITRQIKIGNVLSKEDLDEINRARRLAEAQIKTLEKGPLSANLEEGRTKALESMKRRMSKVKEDEAK